MWPLLKKDGLGLQYFALLLLWNRLIGYNPLRLPRGTFVQLLSLVRLPLINQSTNRYESDVLFFWLLSQATYAAAIGLHILEWIFTPPARYPDLYPVLNVLISTPVFVLAWLWSIKCGIEVGWAMGGLGPSTTTPVSRPTSVVDGGRKSSVRNGSELGPMAAIGEDSEGNIRNRAVSLGYAQSESRRRKGGGKSRSLKSRTSTSSLID